MNEWIMDSAVLSMGCAMEVQMLQYRNTRGDRPIQTDLKVFSILQCVHCTAIDGNDPITSYRIVYCHR